MLSIPSMTYVPKSPVANLGLLALAFAVGGAYKLFNWFAHREGVGALSIGLASLAVGLGLAYWVFKQRRK
jgi:hypothetical protein